ncbi:hypothetical protein R6Z07F_001179 [Ovis aries]
MTSGDIKGKQTTGDYGKLLQLSGSKMATMWTRTIAVSGEQGLDQATFYAPADEYSRNPSSVAKVRRNFKV